MKIEYENDLQGILGQDTTAGKLYRIIYARREEFIGRVCTPFETHMVGFGGAVTVWQRDSPTTRYVECPPSFRVILEQR